MTADVEEGPQPAVVVPDDQDALPAGLHDLELAGPGQFGRAVGCAELAHRGFNTLSGGEKQRALIAQAIAQGADHLILDEPTNHLDIRYQVEILELVSSLGVTVLAAIHDLSLSALFCDTVHLIAGGKLIAGGPPRSVITS